MKPQTKKSRAKSSLEAASEILILADGRVFAHNLTPAMAGVLAELNPADAAMNRRNSALTICRQS